MQRMILTVRRFLLIGVLLSAGLSSPAIAQEVRYSWLDLSFMGQTADNVMGTLETPIVGQFVDVDVHQALPNSLRGCLSDG